LRSTVSGRSIPTLRLDADRFDKLEKFGGVPRASEALRLPMIMKGC
jgi:hypothetical protein